MGSVAMIRHSCVDAPRVAGAEVGTVSPSVWNGSHLKSKDEHEHETGKEEADPTRCASLTGGNRCFHGDVLSSLANEGLRVVLANINQITLKAESQLIR
jgi:hypothetical protein